MKNLKTALTMAWTIPLILVLSTGWLLFPLLILTHWRGIGITGAIAWYAWAGVGIVSELRQRRMAM